MESDTMGILSARDDLLDRITDFQERQKLKGDLREVEGKALVEELRKRFRRARARVSDRDLLLVGLTQSQILHNYAQWQSDYYGSVHSSGPLYFRGIRIVETNDRDYIQFVEQRANAWVAL